MTNRRQQLPDVAVCFKGYFRDVSEQITAAAGAGRVESKPPQAGYLWLVDLVSVAGSGIGGARVNLYRSTPAPDNIIGTVQLGAGDPAAIFENSGADSLWLRPGEPLVATITGAGGATTDLIMSTWFRLHELRYMDQLNLPPDHADEASYAPQGDAGDVSYDAPDEDTIRDRDPLSVGGGPPRTDGGARSGRATGGLVNPLPADPSTPSGTVADF